MKIRELLLSGVALLMAGFFLPTSAWAAATTVREPAFGLPHIYGDTDIELARESGREIAKDRLGQLVLLARVGRGNLYQAFGVLDPGTLSDDIEARRTAYTSSELNNMFNKLPQSERDIIFAYCKGVNDTIDKVYAGSLPEPIEVNILRTTLGLGDDLFGNKTNISDQVDPNYAPAAPGEWPNSGFQFTPEMATAIAVLEIRNFGLNDFGEASRLAELQALIAAFGTTDGTGIWKDLNFLNDPLAPVTVPDPTTPGFGGPLSLAPTPLLLASGVDQFPRYDYVSGEREHKEAAARRAEFASRMGAWPMLGSYAWVIAGGKSASGWPWLGGFPQTGIQTPSIMHFAENRSGKGTDHRINGIGMEFAGSPFVLIGQTDKVAYTSTTAQLRVVDTFFEKIVGENTDTLRYNDMGTPAPLKQRTETFLGAPTAKRVFWRTHERNGNGGSRAVNSFIGDRQGTADSGGATSLVDAGAFDGSFVGGHVAIIDRTGTDKTGVGQIRTISAVPDANTIEVGSAWTTLPDSTFQYVAAKSGKDIVAAAFDSPTWLEETTGALGFFRMQRAENVMDIRAAARVITSTHNYPSVDNQPFNGIGTASANGNIAYYSSGFSRKRQGGLDPLLPLDGTALTNPLVVASGVVDSATPTTLTATTNAFGSSDFSPEPINFRYNNPTQMGSEYIVSIMSGTGSKQTRRIASNTTNMLTIEFPWGVNPASGDTFEVSEISAMPEAINPSEGYMANWNNKAATADQGENFGRQFRHIFILERLAAENAWDRTKNRQLNNDVAGLEGRGDFGRYLIPRLREAVDSIGNGGNPDVDTVLAALEAHQAAPDYGRLFNLPVTDTTVKGEVSFLNQLVNKLALDIYGDEFTAAGLPVPTGSRALNMVQHAIDSQAGDVPGSYSQVYAGDYFNGIDWEIVVRDSLSSLATVPGIPADGPRPNTTYNHPLAGLFPSLSFPPTPSGNRGTYEQIVEAGPGFVKGEFMFPLGQSGLIEGSLAGVTSIDPNVTSLHPIWRDWRFVPLLHVAQGLGPTPGHFMCYKAKTTPGTTKFAEQTVTLTDQFDPDASFTVKKPMALCAPANKNGEGVRDPDTHLEAYQIESATAHVPQTGITVEDQFTTGVEGGFLTVDTAKVTQLLVPSAKGLGAPTLNQPAADVDHYKCYKIKVTPGTPKFPKGVQVTVVDQFEDRLYDVKKPSQLCTPVNKDGEGIINPAGHLMCYKTKRAKGEASHAKVEGLIYINNQFGLDQQLNTVKERELCVPAVKNGQTANDDFDGDGIFDGYERWYYGNLDQTATSDTDADGLTLLGEFTAGAEPINADTDGDGVVDGTDTKPQDRLIP